MSLPQHRFPLQPIIVTSLDDNSDAESSSHISSPSVSTTDYSRISHIFNLNEWKGFYFATLLLSNIRDRFVNELDEQQLLFVNINVYIAVIIETCLNGDRVSIVLQIPAYVVLRLGYGRGHQRGGVAVYVKQWNPAPINKIISRYWGYIAIHTRCLETFCICMLVQ